MINKYKNKYRITSARLQSWDYGSVGAYFITICTQNREYFFGDVENGIMKLSNTGVLADVFWVEIKNHAKGVELGEFVVMPNHIHGILILNGNNDNNDADTIETRHALSLSPSPKPSGQPNEPTQTPGQKRFQNQGKNTVSSIIGSYKSAVTKHAHRLGYDFGWQARFHDHIIRDAKSFDNIQNYIANNPSVWKDDKFYNRVYIT